MAIVALSSCRHKIPLQIKSVFPELSPFFDTRPTAKKVSYLYAPGFQCTEVCMGRYCTEFIAATGEKVSWPSGAQVIGQPHSAVVFPEIDLRKPTSFTLNPITMIINDFRRDCAPLAQRLMQDFMNFTVEDNPGCDESIVNFSYNFSKANLGQKNDIKALHAAYARHLQLYPDADVVLYGDSRGAATIFNFIALHKPSRVKAAILDGIFDSLPHVIKHFLYTDKDLRAEKRLYDIAQFVLGKYQKNGINQRECAEIISDEIPLLIVISLKDGLVPAQSAFYLYSRLHARGNQKVHLLVLKNALHLVYIVSDAQDKKVYETVVHAFYKKYNLPHNALLAREGEKEFALTRPTAEYLQCAYQLPTCQFCMSDEPPLLTDKKINKMKKQTRI